ncbi:unnamed protein product [Owenia fusiformis]|uniref:MICOS complex subunit MIC60 n=1 Tax=Owenia fusiformis TaxID=6347 RepID=A0A8J1T4Z7_OWEFU|nr:unnamed protein product [Owenia fusiformis]
MLRVTKSAVKLRHICPRHQAQNKLCTKPPEKPSEAPKVVKNEAAAKPTRVTPPPVVPPTPEVQVPPPRGGGGRFFKLLGATVMLGVPGAVAYAWYDQNFRKMISTVPYVMEPLDAILNQLPPRETVETPKPKPLKEIAPILKKDSQEASKAKAIKIPDPEPEKTEKPVEKKEKTREELKAEAAAKKKEEQLKKQREKDEIARKIKEKEAEDAAENAALEHILKDMSEQCQAAMDKALAAQIAAIEAVKMHTQQIRHAMDAKESDQEAEWKQVTSSNDNKVTALEAALETTNSTREVLEKLKHAIDEAKSNDVTKRNRELYTNEKFLNKISYELDKSVTKVKKAESEANAMKEFRNLVALGKKQFQKELESITPDVKVGGKGKLSEDELNSLIAHAHRRIEQLQRQLIEQQVLENQRLDAAMEKQQVIDEGIADERVIQELENQRRMFDNEKLKWDAEAQFRYEQEIRQQLARQAAAHSDHLADVLRVQRQELEDQFNDDLKAGIIAEKDRLAAEIAGWIARLKGIESAVEARAELELQGRKAQELWLACQTLQAVIRDGKSGYSWEEQMKPLANELMAIKEAGVDNPFVTLMIDTMPDEAKIRGVWTEESLRERFLNVKRVCKRVAMIDETGGTLFKFFVSWLQSFFVIDAAKILSSDEIDIVKLDTFAILANADYWLRKGDVEQAVRFMNQLTGESRRAATDWINEARLLLETKQCADALFSHASASGLGSLF